MQSLTTTLTSIGIQVSKWNSPTSFNANYTASTDFPVLPPDRLWLRLQDNGTNRISFFSMDGINWIQLHSVGRTDFITADQVGFFATGENASIRAHLSVLSWEES
jgi:hypothetical protein